METETTSDLSIDTDTEWNEDPKALEIPGGGRGGGGGGGGRTKREGSKIQVKELRKVNKYYRKHKEQWEFIIPDRRTHELFNEWKGTNKKNPSNTS